MANELGNLVAYNFPTFVKETTPLRLNSNQCDQMLELKGNTNVSKNIGQIEETAFLT